MKDLTSYNPERLLKLPKQEAEILLNQMELSDQLSLILMAPWERRQELILMSHKAKELVRSMPTQELFWTIKAIGPQDAVHLLEMTSPKQLQFMLDLDWWHKANLRPEKIMAWLVLMFEASEELVTSWIKWISQKDEWLLPAILGLFADVYKRPDDMDIQEARDLLPAFTIDDTYYVEFKKIDLVPILTRFVTKLMEASSGIHRDVMETLLWKTRSEIVEKAYHLRKSRLSDYGLLDYYDSLDIYAPLPKNQVRRIHLRSPKIDTDNLTLPFIPTLYLGQYPTITRAIQALTGTTSLARVLQEWIGAANKLLMADLVDLDDPEAQKNALLKVAALLNLALELESQSSGDRPQDILAVAVVEDLIRLSNRAIRDLCTRARQMVSQGLVPKELTYLPETWAETIRGLLNERPMHWQKEKGEFAWFSSVNEIKETAQLLDKIESWARLISQIEPHWSRWEDLCKWSVTNLTDHIEFLWPRALLTALANWTLNGSLYIRPVPNSDLNRLRHAWYNQDGEPTATHQLCQILTPLAKEAGINTEFLQGEISRLLDELGQEFKGLDWNAHIDARYIGSILVMLGKKSIQKSTD